MSRTLVCGDIHGGYKSLVQVLERCKYDPKVDDIIFLGDYVDGWSQSPEVVSYLIELQQKAKSLGRDRWSTVFLEGNHDVWFKEFLNTGIPDMNWLNNGGRSTMIGYERFSELNGKDYLSSHREFFNSLHEHYIDSENRGFVHAGIDLLGDGLKDTHRHTKLWDRFMWRIVLTGKKVKAHKELYIGHTTTMANKCKAHLPEAKFQEVGVSVHVPMNRQNVWNIDTGGGWSGKLTVMDINTKDFWQSDFVKDLYPEEKGR